MKQGTQASLTLFLIATAFAQEAPSSRPAFEVASIRPADPSGRGQFQLLPGGTVIMRAVTLRLLIQQSYDVRDFQISGGPAWMGSERYDITAKPGNTGDQRASSLDQMRLRLQALLADRFQLKLHRETKELPVFALVVARDGPKLKERPANSGEQGHLRRGRGQLIGQQASMHLLVLTLSRQLGRPVLDQTGLQGSYDFELNWTPDTPAGPAVRQEPGGNPGPGPDQSPTPDQNGPAIFTALQEQLGLKLESTKGPVEVLVIDAAEKASEN
ncbi:MAG: TIGR03435 family protein [Bryobacteraceae bacterium]